ncbi:hypothetical protein KWH52_17350, partial [Proteus mirabilis]|uniref:hypothetical protein n=1 Tax=Proteus mirabilis TaxID=584 RepID=UPI0021D3C23F
TSSLLSTKDLINTTLIYDNIADIPIDLRNALLTPTRDYHDNIRQLPKKLYQWIYDALKTKGASPVMIKKFEYYFRHSVFSSFLFAVYPSLS